MSALRRPAKNGATQKKELTVQKVDGEDDKEGQVVFVVPRDIKTEGTDPIYIDVTIAFIPPLYDIKTNGGGTATITDRSSSGKTGKEITVVPNAGYKLPELWILPQFLLSDVQSDSHVFIIQLTAKNNILFADSPYLYLFLS